MIRNNLENLTRLLSRGGRIRSEQLLSVSQCDSQTARRLCGAAHSFGISVAAATVAGEMAPALTPAHRRHQPHEDTEHYQREATECEPVHEPS
jgi:hypothetical protein